MSVKNELTTLLNRYSKDYPSAWKLAEICREHRKGSGWADYCFLPTGAWAAIVDEFIDESSNRRIFGMTVTALATLGAWRYSQSIYDIHPELYKELISTDFTGKIPVKVLMKMPEWCVYIKTHDFCYDGITFDGFFASLQIFNKDSKPQTELLFTLKETDGCLVPISLPFEEGDDLVSSISKGFERSSDDPETVANWKEHQQIIKEITTPFINLLLYVCSDGVEYSTKERPVMPTSKKTRRYGERLYPAKGPRVWRLGQATGEALESFKERSSEIQDRKGVRPHIRRAHWHTFYAGRRDQEREVRVKWIPPTPIAMPVEE